MIKMQYSKLSLGVGHFYFQQLVEGGSLIFCTITRG